MIRTILIALGVLLILFVGALFIAPSLISDEVYRTQVAAAATEALGRPVEIAGPVKVAVLPSIQKSPRNLDITGKFTTWTRT